MSLLEKALEQVEADRKRDEPSPRVYELPGVRSDPGTLTLRRIYAGYGVLGLIILLLAGFIIYQEVRAGRNSGKRTESSVANISIQLPVPASLEVADPLPAAAPSVRPYPAGRFGEAEPIALNEDLTPETTWAELAADGAMPAGLSPVEEMVEDGEIYAEEEGLFAAPEDPAGELLVDGRLSAHAMNDAGLLYLEKGDLEEARNFFERALRIAPGSEKILNNLGLSYYLEGSYPEAIQYYEMALEINPDNVETYGNLGLTYRKKGRKDRAEQMFRKALALDRTHPEVLYNYGLLLAAGGRSRAARETLEQFLRIAPARLQDQAQSVRGYLAATPKVQ